MISIFLNDLECSLSNVCLYIVKKLHKQDRKNILKMNKEVGMLLPRMTGSMDDNFGEWVESMCVASGRG